MGLLVNLLLKVFPTCQCFPEKGNKEGDFANPESRVVEFKRRKSSVKRDLSHHHLE